MKVSLGVISVHFVKIQYIDSRETNAFGEFMLSKFKNWDNDISLLHFLSCVPRPCVKNCTTEISIIIFNKRLFLAINSIQDLSQEGVPVAAIASFRFGNFLSESPKDL